MDGTVACTVGGKNSISSVGRIAVGSSNHSSRAPIQSHWAPKGDKSVTLQKKERGDCQDGRAGHGTRTVWTCVFLVPIGPGWLETHDEDEDEDDDKSDCHRRCKIELLRVAMESSSSFSRLSSARIATDRRRLLREKEESNKEKGKKKDAPCAYCCITSTSSIKEEKE